MESTYIMITTVLFMNLVDIALTFGTFYKSVSIAQSKCNGTKQEPGMLTTQCILVCQQKNMDAAIQEDGQCFCLDPSCAAGSAETEEDHGNPQQMTTSVFRRVADDPNAICITGYASTDVCCPEGWLGKHCDKEARVLAIPAYTTNVPSITKHIPQTNAFTICGWLNPIPRSNGIGHIIAFYPTENYIMIVESENKLHLVIRKSNYMTITDLLPYNKWSHFCFSWNTDNAEAHMITYQNGRLTKQTTSYATGFTTPIDAKEYLIAIGNDIDNGVINDPSQVFLGQLADWNFYTKKLSPAEVISVYHGEQMSNVNLAVSWKEFMMA